MTMSEENKALGRFGLALVWTLILVVAVFIAIRVIPLFFKVNSSEIEQASDAEPHDSLDISSVTPPSHDSIRISQTYLDSLLRVDDSLKGKNLELAISLQAALSKPEEIPPAIEPVEPFFKKALENRIRDLEASNLDLEAANKSLRSAIEAERSKPVAARQPTYHPHGAGNGKLSIYSKCQHAPMRIWVDGEFWGSTDVYFANADANCGQQGTISKVVIAGKHHIQTEITSTGSSSDYVTVMENECFGFSMGCNR